VAQRVGPDDHALQPRHRMRRLTRPQLKVMSSMRVGMRYLEPVTPPDTLAEVQERVVLRA
jgi:hypothetical protein